MSDIITKHSFYLAGQRGEKGEQGEQGEKGERGFRGYQGEQGIQGEQGDSAYKVAVDNGFVGTEQEWIASLKGEKGEKGDQGVQGIQGNQGIQGDKGDQGNGVIIKGVFETFEELPTDLTEANIGDCYIAAAVLYVWTATGWQKIGNFDTWVLDEYVRMGKGHVADALVFKGATATNTDSFEKLGNDIRGLEAKTPILQGYDGVMEGANGDLFNVKTYIFQDGTMSMTIDGIEGEISNAFKLPPVNEGYKGYVVEKDSEEMVNVVEWDYKHKRIQEAVKPGYSGRLPGNYLVVETSPMCIDEVGDVYGYETKRGLIYKAQHVIQGSSDDMVKLWSGNQPVIYGMCLGGENTLYAVMTGNKIATYDRSSGNRVLYVDTKYACIQVQYLNLLYDDKYQNLVLAQSDYDIEIFDEQLNPLAEVSISNADGKLVIHGFTGNDNYLYINNKDFLDKYDLTTGQKVTKSSITMYHKKGKKMHYYNGYIIGMRVDGFSMVEDSSFNPDGTNGFSKNVTDVSNAIVDLKVDPYGNVYLLDVAKGLYKYNVLGTKYWDKTGFWTSSKYQLFLQDTKIYIAGNASNVFSEIYIFTDIERYTNKIAILENTIK